MAKRTGLGRGIGALIPTTESAEARPVDVFFPGASSTARTSAGATDVVDATDTPDVPDATDATEAATADLVAVPGARLVSVDPNEIVPNPRQPRTNFDPDDLAEDA